jgi:uncharacterized membrane protein YebE (DUF533 family)
MLTCFEKQQAHDQLLNQQLVELHRGAQRQENRNSWQAFVLVLAFAGSLAGFLVKGLITEASIFGGILVALAGLARVFRHKP